jgi:hypothetical protein
MNRRCGLENMTDEDMERLRALEGFEPVKEIHNEAVYKKMDAIDIIKSWVIIATLGLILVFLLAL